MYRRVGDKSDIYLCYFAWCRREPDEGDRRFLQIENQSAGCVCGFVVSRGVGARTTYWVLFDANKKLVKVRASDLVS